MKRILCLLLISLILLFSGCVHTPVPNALASQITIDMHLEDVEAILGEPYFMHYEGAPGAWSVRCYKADEQYVFISYLATTEGYCTYVLWIYDQNRQLLAAASNPAFAHPNHNRSQLTVNHTILEESFDHRHLWEFVNQYDYYPLNRIGLSSYSYSGFFPTDDGRCLHISCGEPFQPDSMESYEKPWGQSLYSKDEGIFWIIEAEETDYFTGTTQTLLDMTEKSNLTVFEINDTLQRDYLRQKGIEE